MRKEQREERYQRRQQELADSREETQYRELNISVEGMKTLQENDPTLKEVRRSVEAQESKYGVGFFKKDGLLYRRWIPKGREEKICGTTCSTTKVSQSCHETCP